MALGRGKDKKKAAGKPARTGPSRRERVGQIGAAFTMTRKADSRMLPLVLGTFLIVLAVFVLLGILLSHPVVLGVFGFVFALLGAVAVFGRRVQRTAYGQVEGQLGAAAAVLSNIRGNWRVSPAVGFNKEQDLLHRVIGRPGIILVGEGNPNRVRNLVGTEKRRLSRLVGDTPIYDVTIGEGEGRLPLKELEKHLAKLPRNIKPARVNELEARLKALGAAGGTLPIPKGPMPTRVPRGRAR